jgi:hypothetical protein
MSSTIRIGIALILFALAFLNPLKLLKRIPSIDIPGFNVLIVTDTSEGTTVDNLAILSTDVRKWLRDNADGVKVWDDSHTDFQYVDSQWQRAYQKALEDSDGKRPWVIISGSKNASQALPETSKEFIDLLEYHK